MRKLSHFLSFLVPPESLVVPNRRSTLSISHTFTYYTAILVLEAKEPKVN